MTDDLQALRTRVARLESRLRREQAAREAAEDIAERTIADLHVREVEARQARSDVQAFLDAASHDLRLPVMSLSGFVGLLLESLEGGCRASAEPMVAPIQRNLAFLEAMTVDLLDFARAGSNGGDRAAVDLAAVARDVVARTTLPVTLTTHPVPTVLLVAVRAQQLLTNLLANAANYAGPGVHVTVEPGPPPAPGLVRVLVGDDGPGIAAEDVEAAFQPFVRLDQEQRDEPARPGTGLGLPACRRLCRAAGGDLTVVPDRDGAWFAIDLPSG